MKTHCRQGFSYQIFLAPKSEKYPLCPPPPLPQARSFETLGGRFGWMVCSNAFCGISRQHKLWIPDTIRERVVQKGLGLLQWRELSVFHCDNEQMFCQFETSKNYGQLTARGLQTLFPGCQERQRRKVRAIDRVVISFEFSSCNIPVFGEV